jgi:hypothetical protein
MDDQAKATIGKRLTMLIQWGPFAEGISWPAVLFYPWHFVDSSLKLSVLEALHG